MELTKKEALAIVKVLNEGMPNEDKKRQFLAEISLKLEDFIENGFEATK